MNEIKTVGGYQLTMLLLDGKLGDNHFVEDYDGNRFIIKENKLQCVYHYEDFPSEDIVLESRYTITTLDAKGFPTYYSYHDFYDEDGK